MTTNNDSEAAKTDGFKKALQPARRAATGKLKFKHTSSNLSNFAFAKDQTWVNRSTKNEIFFVDQAGGNSEEARRRAQSRKRRTEDVQIGSSGIDEREDPNPRAMATTESGPSASFQHFDPNSINGRRSLPVSSSTNAHSQQPNDVNSHVPDRMTAPNMKLNDSRVSYPRSLSSDAYNSASPVTSIAGSVSSGQHGGQSPANGSKKDDVWVLTNRTPVFLEDPSLSGPLTADILYDWPARFGDIASACLVRVSLEILSRWADAGYPNRHFHITLPALARTFPPLMNAILTCAATHLLSTPAYRASNGAIQYRGIALPTITREAVIRCHGASVTDLLEYCNESSRDHDDQLLAALTMLRYHEELLSIPDQGEDKGQLLRIFNTFLTARKLQDAICSPGGTPTSNKKELLAYYDSLHHAVIRLALRQEITSAYVLRTPVQMNLEPWLPLDAFAGKDVEGSIWADKTLLHCVRVNNFCYGLDVSGRSDEWARLKQTEVFLERSRPDSLAPLLWQTDEHKVFPLIWYDSVMPICGVQWLGLAKILLAMYNPNSLSVTSGIHPAHQQNAGEVRSIVRTICAIADSNPTAQPAYVHARMAIMVGGVFFADHREQDAMLAILAHLEYEFGWPTSSEADKLRSLWHRSP